MLVREIGLGFIGKDIPNNLYELDEFSHFTQPESQKALYILKVLTVLDGYHELNTSAIIEKTGLSSKSVVGTLRMLRDRGLVDYKVRKKWNNEKIYSIRRLRALFYILKLIQWKFNRNFPQTYNKVKALEEEREGRELIHKKINEENLEWLKKEIEIVKSKGWTIAK